MADESPGAQHQPWQTKTVRLGVSGVNLAKAANGLDSLSDDEVARLTNAFSGQGGGITVRPGATRLQTFGGAFTNVHSCSRLYSPDTAATTHFWGVDASWIRAEGATVAVLESGFSGDPLMQVAWGTEFGAVFRMYVADRLKMRRAGFGVGSGPIGLPKAAQPASVTAEALGTKIVASFAAGDASAFSDWSPSGGPDKDFDGATHIGSGGVPILSAIVGPDGNGVNMASVIGTATTGYSFWMNLPRALDLSTFGGGIASTDDDIIHVLIRMDFPSRVEEIRIYFIVSPFDPSPIPGTNATRNASAYVRSYFPGDYAGFVAGINSAIDAADQGRESDLLAGFNDPLVTGGAIPSSQGLPGAHVFAEFGKPGLPIRKADFIKIGQAGLPGFDWSTVTGLCIYVQMKEAENVNIAFDQLWLQGGAEVDSSEPDAQPLDYRVVNYDTVTGARSNPSDVQTTTIDVMRQKVDIQPVAYGSGSVIQEAYRRGASLVDNWYYVGKNAVDGGVIVDNTPDEDALVAGSVAIDHDQPITTVDTAGATILAQPVPVLFGPISGYLFAAGDPYRPGFLYWCKRNEPDHWPPANCEATCPHEEELMNGGEYSGGAFIFSRSRLYSIQVNLMDGSISTNPTDCAEGLFARYGMAIGAGGLFFVARDAVRVTQGGASQILSDNIRPLFQPGVPGQSIEGYYPIDFTQPKLIRLELHGDDLWFGFRDTAGSRVWWVYSLTYKTWRFAKFGMPVGMVYSDPSSVTGLRLLLGGSTTGNAYTHDGFTDDGTVIAWNVRTGAQDFGHPREEKLLGDVMVWGNLWGSTLTVQALLNEELVVNTAATVLGSVSDERYLFDLFGTVPQHAQTISIDLAGTGATAGSAISPFVSRLGVSFAVEPEITMNRATTWQSLNDQGENYLTGCYIDSDTGGTDRTILVEGLLNGAPVAVATLTVNSDAGRRQWFSWAAKHVDMVRLRPTGDCAPWMLFGQGWIATPEPPRIAVWDTGFETLGDTYYTGLDLEVDTFGLDKTIQIFVDQVLVLTKTINGNGRSFIHVTLPWGRGHIYRFAATDGNLGLLYTHKWIVEKEPGEQANWNQNFTVASTLADKWLKGILLECDTFGLDKDVTIEVDGVVTSTQTVNKNGRKVAHISFPQVLGRVFRIFPTDANPGRLYSSGWLFDTEPYQLTRYETQEQPDGIMDFHLPVAGQIAIKSNADVEMTVIAYGQEAVPLSVQIYTLESTGGDKAMLSLHLILQPQKGLLFKYLFTSAAGFWLYRGESWIEIQNTSGGGPVRAKVFGDDDLDMPARPMHNAEALVAHSGGAS